MTLEPYETIVYKNHVIEVVYDTYPVDPREWDNLGTIITKRFWNECDYINANDRDAVLDHIKVVKNNGGIVLPIYCYSHGIDRFKTSSFYGCGLPQGHARFDSGVAGFIYATAETVRKEYGVQRISKRVRDLATKVLQSEIEIIDNYSSGQVYGYIIKTADGEEIESCYGYYGEAGREDMVSECKSMIDHIMAEPMTRAPVIALLD